LSTPTNRRWSRRPDGSNWGDFGPDDQVGRLNTVTPAMRLAALAEVKEGICFALSLPLDLPGGDGPETPRRAPQLFPTSFSGHQMVNLQISPTDVSNDDGVTMSLQYSTQWDSLAHWGRLFDVDDSGTERPVYYNGHRAGIDLRDQAGPDGPGLERLGIENMAMTGVQTRGVLVDLGRAYGTGRTLVDHDLLSEAIAKQGVEVRPGDVLLLRTGYDEALVGMGGEPDEEVLERTGAALDGSDDRLLDWIEESGIVAIASDNTAVEAVKLDFDVPRPGGRSHLPLHDRCLFRLGMHLGELWWLSELADHLAAVGRHAFLLTAPPLRLPGAAGSPVTPVATV
jgi:kynurenine formamidase